MDYKRIFKMMTFYDKVLITFILTASIILFGAFSSNALKSSNGEVVVQQNGTVVLQLTQEDLNNDGIYNFKFNENVGYIEVKNKMVRMLPMDKKICPDAICSETGWVSGGPKIIVCMPNSIIVSFKTIERNDITKDIDVYVF